MASASRRSLRGLDWFNFFIADVQTGFGPFIAVYLTTHAWTQVEIGLVLTVGGIIGLAGQVPGGAIIDAMRGKRRVAAYAVGGIGLSALAIAAWPIFPIVLFAKVLHSAASCLVSPAIAAISLGLVGRRKLGERLGRNARFASVGAGFAAALMGAIGYELSNRAVFLVTAAFAIPTLIALAQIRAEEIDPARASGVSRIRPPPEPQRRLRVLLENRPLVIFAGCLLLFYLANAAMLPLVAGLVTMRASDSASLMIAACMVVPQIVVAIISPWVGRQADLWGRKPLLLLAFAALIARGVAFAMASHPYALIAIQILDGLSAAVFAVMLPLVAADVTRGTGHFNLTQGALGTAMGVGASLSTTLAGYLADTFGGAVAFLGLAGIALMGLLLLWTSLPETKTDLPLDHR
ncbi:MAG TPA: MFS transporter [Alphaproteobacteria bacterium]|nr:MFS transporter [Alphaproteobacteria bacterium]